MPETTPLADKLRRQIAENGPLPLEHYMQACLGDPEHGYYVTHDPLGARGDFTTAPEISQIFGELIGLWCTQVWHTMGAPSPFHLIELGPGRGTLMVDALRAATIVPAFLEATSLHLVETSPVLREKQKKKLSSQTPEWHDAMANVPEGASLIIANEFLDALPVRQYQQKKRKWYERCVDIKGGAFVSCLSETALDDEAIIPQILRQQAREDDIAEVRPAVVDLLSAFTGRTETAPLAALFIDYGHIHSAAGDSFQAVKAHDFADPLIAPGEHDLTAHVDFADLAEKAHAKGLEARGPLSQRTFLLSLGLAQRCEQLMKNADGMQRKVIEAGAARLVDPDGMGSLFKVLAITSPDLPPTPALGE